MKKHFTFSSTKKKYLLLGLLVIALAGSAVWLKYYSPYAPQPLESSANEPTPHWPHATIPFNLTINNHAPKAWADTFSAVVPAWNAANIISYTSIKPAPLFQCYPIILPPPYTGLHTCSFSDPESPAAVYGYFQYGSDDPHIYAGIVAFNDYYVNAQTLGNSLPFWRNRLLCQGLGFTAGLPYHLDPAADANSCMNVNADESTIASLQFPSKDDFHNMKSIYDHSDAVNIPAMAEKMKVASKSLSVNQFGTLTGSFNQDKIQTYSLDLGNSYSFKTMVVKASK